jgi:hypothetical protein
VNFIRLTPALSNGEGAKKHKINTFIIKVLSFGEDLGEANSVIF